MRNFLQGWQCVSESLLETRSILCKSHSLVSKKFSVCIREPNVFQIIKDHSRLNHFRMCHVSKSGKFLLCVMCQKVEKIYYQSFALVIYFRMFNIF